MERVVLLSAGNSRDRVAGIGVAGIGPERTVLAPAEGCAPAFHDPNTVAAITARSAITKALGRAPDSVIGSYDATRVNLPSGRIEESRADSMPTPAGFDAEVWSKGTRFYPAGLLQVSPDAIITASEAVRYDILPSQIGIAQLIGSGAIEKMADGAFKIVKPIAHYPASLNGAHAVTFVLAPGVPSPGGDPGHSCVVKEESGEMIGNSLRCRWPRAQ